MILKCEFRQIECAIKPLMPQHIADQKNDLMSLFQNVQFCSRSRKAKILTAGIYRIFRGLKFEHDAEIVQKWAF